MSFRPRRALVGLVTAAAALAALPAAASATITPALTLDQSAGTAAGTSPAIAFNAAFAPDSATPTDTVKDIKLALPPGLLANENIAGGACLLSSAPSPACKIGSGSLTAGGNSISATAYLTKPPSPTDVGGLTIVAPPLPSSTADITLGPTGLTIAFSNLSAGVSALNITFTDLRLPTSCPSPAANVTLTADSQQSATPVSTTKPLAVTGCNTLPYAPALAASVTKDAKDSGAAVTLAITQAAGESASKSIVLGLAKGLSPNGAADIPCLGGKGCTVGTATATSPLVPSLALSTGTVTLGGTALSPVIAITFPTLGLTIPGTVSLTTNSVTFANIADLPLTNLTLKITGPNGPNGQKAFTTDCAPASVTGTFTPQSGTAAKTVTAPIKFTGCVANPIASGSTSGLGSGQPRLTLKVTHGKGAPNVATVAIGLPAGLNFSHAAIVSHKTCTNKGKTKKCTTTTLIKGLGISGAQAQSVAIKGGRLVISLKKPAAGVTITVVVPLLHETKALETKVRKHKAGRLKFSLKITDAKSNATTPSLALKAH